MRPSVLASLLLAGLLPWGSPAEAKTRAPAATRAVADFPDGFESYLSRPDILKVRPKSHPELGESWNQLVRAHLEGVALLVEMYPDREIYFLARDSEYLYDLARFLTRDEPSVQKRLHLLNLSRANMRADHVKEYLAQEGISVEALEKGKNVLFVDTGFSGTIPAVIQSYFPEALRDRLRTHLICSSNPLHPSMRVFLGAINPAINTVNPGSMHGTIISYEHMPRFTDRSDRFHLSSDGVWHPLSQKEGSVDGKVSKPLSQAYREDLLHEAVQTQFQDRFRLQRDRWHFLRSLVDSKATASATQKKLRKFLESHPKDAFVESSVRDFRDMFATRIVPFKEVGDLGLPEIALSKGGSNKLALMKKHPEWASILENPQPSIKALIQEGNFSKLGAIADVVVDTEFSILLASELGAHGKQPGVSEFIEMLIQKKDLGLLNALAVETFSHPNTAHLSHLLDMFVELADPRTLGQLARETLSRPHVQNLEHLIRRTIERGTVEAYVPLATSVFSQPHTAGMENLIVLLIQKENSLVQRYLADYTFSHPHTEHMHTALKLLVEEGDMVTLSRTARSAFSKPHTEKMGDLLQILINRGNADVLETVASEVFQMPHSRHWGSLMKAVMERADIKTLYTLARHLTQQAHWEGRSDLVRLLMEHTSYPAILSMLEDHVLTQATPNRPEYRVLREALQIGDQKARVQFLLRKLGPASIVAPPANPSSLQHCEILLGPSPTPAPTQ